jgi:hypothetical protein
MNRAAAITSFLESVPPDRLQTLEVGAKGVQIIAPQQARIDRLNGKPGPATTSLNDQREL